MTIFKRSFVQRKNLLMLIGAYLINLLCWSSCCNCRPSYQKMPNSKDIKLQRIFWDSSILSCVTVLSYVLLWWGLLVIYYYINRSAKQPLPKTVSALNFNSYRLMVRQSQFNHLVYCRNLLNQFIVDIYTKIETERLNAGKVLQAISQAFVKWHPNMLWWLS